MGEGEAMRIYIGGVGPTVTAADVEKTFSPLGAVSGVELVRTNGRKFAYMNFRPTSEKSLAKLFSAYNGCSWKGGKLKLERAKEHYLDRLKREWAEDTKLISETPNDPKIEKFAGSSKLERLNLENMQLQIYFPKLRRVKSLPFKGTGKHKYSFQRVEVPPLPLHFCDCEEHREPSEKASLKYLSSVNSGIHYEKELSVMNSVMNKLLDKENNENVASKDTLSATTGIISDPSIDSVHEEESEETLEMDGDNLVTNIGTGRRDDVLMQLVEETLAVNQLSKVGKHQSLKAELNQNKVNTKRRQNSGLADSSEVTVNKGANAKLPDNITENEFSAILLQNMSSDYNSEEPQVFAEPPPNKSQSEPSTISQSWSQKSSWRKLVGGMENKPFSITNVLPGNISFPQNQSKSDGSALGALLEQKKAEVQPERKKSKSLPVTHDPLVARESSDNETLAETHAETEPDTDQIEPRTIDTQSTRGQSWLQKSSWRDLVGGMGNTSFSITNVLPEISSLPPNKPKSSNSVVNTLSEGKKAKAQPDGRNLKTFPIKKDEHREPQKACENPRRAIMQETGISDVCTFMRSAESQKEWSKARAALSRHLNKKRKNTDDDDSRKTMKDVRPRRSMKG